MTVLSRAAWTVMKPVTMLTPTNVGELVQKGLRLHRNQTSKFSSRKFCKKKFFCKKNFIKNFLKKNFKKKIFSKKFFIKNFIKISKNSSPSIATLPGPNFMKFFKILKKKFLKKNFF